MDGYLIIGLITVTPLYMSYITETSLFQTSFLFHPKKANLHLSFSPNNSKSLNYPCSFPSHLPITQTPSKSPATATLVPTFDGYVELSNFFVSRLQFL